jgi:ABC-2 type transport system ATP-binding protein
MLVAHELRKAYGPRVAVHDVSLSVDRGQIVGLLGPNGAGKSTTVAMLCGLLEPDGGTVSVDGASLRGATAPARRRLGIVPQELALYEELPARDNVRLFGALYGVDRGTLAARADEALAFVQLLDRARDEPATFSGGMKRRLNLACALAHDPDILLLDEPTVGVDPQSRNAIFEYLEALRARGKALLYTTHYMEEAERLCDRILIIDQGRIVADDTLAGLRSRLPAARGVTLQLQGTVDAGLRALLAARGVDVTESTAPASLEDVFLQLTGRSLRDET